MYHQGTTSSHVTFFLEQAGELHIIILRRMENSGLTAPHTNPHPHTHNTFKPSTEPHTSRLRILTLDQKKIQEFTHW